MLPHSFPQYSSQVTTSKCWWAEWRDLVVGVLSNMKLFLEKMAQRATEVKGHVQNHPSVGASL